jgi:transcriptional regulator with XRE-family HTH domain
MAGLMHEDGRGVNYSAFARECNLATATISRIMRDKSDRVLSAETLSALVKAFRITFEQARGDVPVRRQRGRSTVPTEAELELIRDRAH